MDNNASLTIAAARAAGYTVERGANRGTTDDRADRWYWYGGSMIRRTGVGYATRSAALADLARHIAINAEQARRAAI